MIQDMVRRQGITILLLVILATLLLFKLHLSLTRQFDPDELSYLHWAYLLTQGKLPYKDFFFFIAPVYPAFLTPLFLLPQGPEIALVGRVVMFGVYLLTLGVLFTLVKRTTGNIIIALLTILIFTAFPMTFDKTIEIRPDMVMVLLFLESILLLIPNIDNKTGDGRWGTPTKGSPCGFSWGKTPDRTRLFLCAGGICFSLSFLTMFKIIFALPAILFLLLITNKRSLKDVVFFLLGCSLPFVIFLLWLWTNHLIFAFFHAVTYDAAIVNVGNATFSFLTTLSPFPIMYVERGGVSFPWLVNTLLWILAAPGLLLLFKNKPRVGLFSFLLLGGAFSLLVFFPKPYVQYFILPTMIISLSAAYALVEGSKKRFIIVLGFSLILLVSFFIQHQSRQEIRYQNTEQLQVLSDIGKIIKPDELVYDMVGSYVFRPDGYFICCHPYTQFVHLLQKPIPNLTDSLIATKTKFLVMDQKGYVFWITAPSDQQFLLTHYLTTQYNKIYSLGSAFQCINGSCFQYTLHGKPTGTPTEAFQIVIKETYRVKIDPSNQSITIGNHVYRNGEIADLDKGTYSFIPSLLVNSFSIQLAR